MAGSMSRRENLLISSFVSEEGSVLEMFSFFSLLNCELENCPLRGTKFLNKFYRKTTSLGNALHH